MQGVGEAGGICKVCTSLAAQDMYCWQIILELNSGKEGKVLFISTWIVSLKIFKFIKI
jgi:hypothetical protein